MLTTMFALRVIGDARGNTATQQGDVLKLRSGCVLAGTMALTATTFVMTAGTAFADDPPGGIVWDGIWKAPGVTVYVEAHGDVIAVCDSKANNHSASVIVYSGRGYEMKVTNGKGSCKSHQASDGGPYNLPEHTTITITYTGDGGAHQPFANFRNDH